MRFAVIGGRGNMGQRYCTILNWLQHEAVPVDIADKCPDSTTLDGYIIATPTQFHIKDILTLGPTHLPILCEKPIATHAKDVRAICKVIEDNDWQVTMVNQYEQLGSFLDNGPSFYDYFKTGPHGMAWDCINILGLAKGEVWLNNKSPVWVCSLNGRELNIKDMDSAYIKMMQKWIRTPNTPGHLQYIVKAHEKAEEYAKTIESAHWCASAVN